MVKIASPDKASTPSQLLASSSKSPAWATEKNTKKFGSDLGFVQLFTQMNSMEASRQNSSAPAETGRESVVIPEDVAFAAPHEKTGVGAPTTAVSAGIANAAARSHHNTRGHKKTVVKTVRFAATELAVIENQLKGRDFSEIVRALLLGAPIPEPKNAVQLKQRRMSEFEARKIQLLAQIGSALAKISAIARTNGTGLQLLATLISVEREIRRALS